MGLAVSRSHFNSATAMSFRQGDGAFVYRVVGLYNSLFCKLLTELKDYGRASLIEVSKIIGINKDKLNKIIN